MNCIIPGWTKIIKIIYCLLVLKTGFIKCDIELFQILIIRESGWFSNNFKQDTLYLIYLLFLCAVLNVT